MASKWFSIFKAPWCNMTTQCCASSKPEPLERSRSGLCVLLNGDTEGILLPKTAKSCMSPLSVARSVKVQCRHLWSCFVNSRGCVPRGMLNWFWIETSLWGVGDGVSLMPGGCDERVKGKARHRREPARMCCLCSTVPHNARLKRIMIDEERHSPPVQQTSPLNISFSGLCCL